MFVSVPYRLLAGECIYGIQNVRDRLQKLSHSFWFLTQLLVRFLHVDFSQQVLPYRAFSTLQFMIQVLIFDKLTKYFCQSSITTDQLALVSAKASVWTVLSSVLWHCRLSVRKSIRPVKIEWRGVGVVVCLDRGEDCLHMVQLMPLPFRNPIISCLI